ncbi:hypothetical protein OSL69_17905 [Escherichia coli]|nr:hypothetical protein [Salmonella enterica]EKZ9716379.1 hypothetical protein [Klebsiella pneumoniae]MDA6929218.1 hypothetical protein [Escherichia coli]
MKTEKPYADLLKPECLYSMLRAYIIECAPFALTNVDVSDVINTYMGRNSGYPFIMSSDLPPQFSGKGYEIFGAYKNTENEHKLNENSAAWFCCKLTYLETEHDVKTFNEALNAMMRWMYATEYLIKDECGYLPTQKLFNELTLKIKRDYGDK